MLKPRIVSKEEWLAARQAHLANEKSFDRERDQLSKERRQLPWTRVDTQYRFDSTDGHVTLSDLFAGASQLIIYHFMYHPSWREGGCPSCSYLADHFDGMIPHLNNRDVAFVVVAKARLEQIEEYRQRMGWTFKWVSSFNNDFNADFNVSFTAEEMEKGGTYNYKEGVRFPQEEAPGASVFAKDEAGNVFHTYSTFARGLDKLIGTYHFLDMTSTGRNEEDLPWPMAWIRRHDEYGR